MGQGKGRFVRAILVLGIFAMGFGGGPAAGAGTAVPTPEFKPPLVNPSIGCGLAPPVAPPTRVEVGGEVRSLIAAVPEDYEPDQPHQLVFAFHGRTSPNGVAQRYFGLERSGAERTIYVYPSGLKGDDGGFSWWEVGDPNDVLRDYALFDALYEIFTDRYCIDLGRVFAVGHSLGASFANSLGCARGDVVRAIATLAGGVMPANCRAPTAAVILHNPNDRLVDIGYGIRARNLYLAGNGYGRKGYLVKRGDFACTRYGGVGDLDPVLWCPHNVNYQSNGRYYPHQWPRGLGTVVMAFFESLPPPEDSVLAAALQH